MQELCTTITYKTLFLLIHNEGSLLGLFNTKQQALEFQLKYRLQNSSEIKELEELLNSLIQLHKE